MEGGPPDLPAGHAGLRALFDSFGPITQEWTIHEVIAEGDKVVLRATNRCTQDEFLGIPAAGKSTLTRQFVADGYLRLNRDERGGTLRGLLPELRRALQDAE